MFFFEQYQEFVDSDSRKERIWSRVTAESLTNRHETTLPRWLVENNSILDLGSCLGATGHWCLTNGCQDYTGVEVQPEMAATSRELLGKYWSKNQFNIVEQDIRGFLDSEIEAGMKYDVVVLAGVIYSFADTYSILQKVAELCRYCVIIDSVYPYWLTSPNAPVIEVLNNQRINSNVGGFSYHGVGARPSPQAIRNLMDTLGFQDKEGLLYPKPISDKTVHDSYTVSIRTPGTNSYTTPARFLIRLFNVAESKFAVVADNVLNNNEESLRNFGNKPPTIDVDKWNFDEDVAGRFQTEAQTHIPDYERVVDLSCRVLGKIYNKDKSTAKIIDVGSSLGYTMSKLIEAGFQNVYGVDNSEAMCNACEYDVFHDDKLPDGSWDGVIINWTLHFVKQRKEYLADVYDKLNNYGTLIITDKMQHTDLIETLYHEFKRNNGITDEEIETKKQSLIGVLDPKPLTWYINTLTEIGYSDIQVINSNLMFTTIYARKYE